MSATTIAAPRDDTDEMERFYEEVKRVHGRALWQTEGPSKVPTTLPYLWRYRDFRPLLFKAAEIVPMELAERRALFMANPGILHDWQASNTLLANLQIIKPGEIAPSHRHAGTALRLIVEGTGAYTAVDGEKSYMEPGDFLTTPGGTWHDHGNESSAEMIWLDGLDVPLVQFFEAAYYDAYSQWKHPVTRPDNVSLRIYGSGSLRPTWLKHEGKYSPLLNYTFAQTYATLKSLAEMGEGSPYDGTCMEYVNPLTGGPALPTIGCFASLLLPGQHTKAHRHTGSTVYHVIQGKGTSVIAGKTYDWDEKDTFVVPSWTFHEHQATKESVLFSYTDGTILPALGLYREGPLEENGGYQRVTGKFEPLPVPERAPPQHSRARRALN